MIVRIADGSQNYSADYIAVNTWNMSGMFIVL